MRNQGRITRWNDKQGYGFVVPDEGGKDLFVHIKSFVHRRRRPVDCDVVSFEVETDSEGRPQTLRVLFEGEQNSKPRNKRFKRLQRSTILVAFNLILVAVFFLFLVAAVATGRLHIAIIYLYCIMSSVSFLAYVFDKSAAIRGKWRTPEKTLHLLDLLCGWPGGLIAQTVSRHKTSKLSFLITTWFMIMLNCGVLLYAAPLLSRGAAALLDVPQQIGIDNFFQDERSNDEDPNHGIKITPQ